MAINYLNSINLNQNELQHAVIENQGSDALAGTGVDGQLYFNTSQDKLKIWKNEGWTEVDDFSIGFTFNTNTGLLTATISNESDVTVDLDGRYLLPADIQGTQDEVEVSESNGIVTIGLPDDVTIASQLTVGTTSSTDTPAIISRTSSTGTNLLLESTAAGSSDSPDLVLYRNVTPHSSGDYLGSLKFRGNASGGEGSFDYSTMNVVMTGADEASIVFDSETVSSDRTGLFAIHGASEGSVVVNPTSATQIPTHTLDVNGDANISDDLGVGGNLVVTGNLTVSGNTITKLSETVNIEDNLILLNSNETGSPTEDGGIEIERGTSTNVSLLWDESAGRWSFTNDGSTYHNIPVSDEYDNFYLDVSVVGSGTQEVSDGGVLTFDQGGGLTATLSGDDTVTYSHADTSSQASVDNSGRTYIQDITLDTYGHITGITSATETVTDTQLATATALIDVSAMGSNTTASFTHSLASKNLIVQMYDVTTGEVVFADIDHTSINAISIIFAQTPTSDIRVVVIDAKHTVADSTVTYS